MSDACHITDAQDMRGPSILMGSGFWCVCVDFHRLYYLGHNAYQEGPLNKGWSILQIWTSKSVIG